MFAFDAEFTTLSGRRLRDALQAVLTASTGQFNGNVHVVLAGLSNTYSQYITTFEEYEIHRYEVSELVMLHAYFLVVRRGFFCWGRGMG